MTGQSTFQNTRSFSPIHVRLFFRAVKSPQRLKTVSHMPQKQEQQADIMPTDEIGERGLDEQTKTRMIH